MALTTNTALAQLQPSGIRRITAFAKQTPGCILLTLGEPDGNTADVVKEEVAKSLAANETHYPPNNGTVELRRAISAHMEKRNLAYGEDEIIVTCGATEALFAALSSILNPGDEVLVPTPAFGLYESIISVNRATFVPIDTRPTKFQLTLEQLEAAATDRMKAIVLTSPNNPTGCVFNPRSLDAVAKFAKAHDIFVICDDVYTSLVYEGVYKSDEGMHLGFASCYSELRDRIIVCDSFSKPYAMTGWRLGWVAADAPISAQIAKMHQYMVSSVPSFVQRAAIRALKEDVAPAREVYRGRRDYVLARLREIGLDVVEPDGAFYVFPSIEKFGMSSDEFCTRLIAEKGVALVPGSCFAAEGFVRLSYCCSMENLEEGLNRLAAFVQTLEQRSV